MPPLFPIVIFFLLCWMLGFVATYWLDEEDDLIERNILRVGVGLGLLPVVGAGMNLVGVPLDFRLFLVVFGIPATILIFKRDRGWARSRIAFPDLPILGAVLLSLLLFLVFLHGSFAYPYLEDDDAWHHAGSISYVATQKSLFTASPSLFKYLDPYPPGYALLLGLLHQAGGSLIWTMKFFNALLAAFAGLLFYSFAHRFLGEKQVALMATLFLTAIPCFLTHFIWALVLAVATMFPALYAIERARTDRRWWMAAALLLTGICLSQPSLPVKLFFFFLCTLAIRLHWRQWALYASLAWICAGALSFLLWWGPMLYRHGSPFVHGWRGIYEQPARGLIFDLPHRPFREKQLEWGFRWAGSGDLRYTVGHFVWTKARTVPLSQDRGNLINSPFGLGPIMSLLTVWGAFAAFLISRRQGREALVPLAWTLLSIFGILGAYMPIQFFAYRFWLFLAVGSSMLAAMGFSMLEKWVRRRWPGWADLLLVLLFIGLVFTSYWPKQKLNTFEWSFGGARQWTGAAILREGEAVQIEQDLESEVVGYVALQALPAGSRIFPFARAHRNQILAFGHSSDEGDPILMRFRSSLSEREPWEMYQWLKNRGYEYMIVDTTFMREELLRDGGVSFALDVIGSEREMPRNAPENLPDPDMEEVQRHFDLLTDRLRKSGFFLEEIDFGTPAVALFRLR